MKLSRWREYRDKLPVGNRGADVLPAAALVTASFLAGSVLGYIYGRSLFGRLRSMLGDALFYLAEPSRIDLALWMGVPAGLVAALPAVVAIWCCRSGKGSRRAKVLVSAALIPASLILALAGGAAGLLYVLPQAVALSGPDAVEGVRSFLSADRYVWAGAVYVALMAVAGQLLVLLPVLLRLGAAGGAAVSSRRLWVWAGVVAVCIQLPAAGGIAGRLLLAAPLLVLFEAGLLLGRVKLPFMSAIRFFPQVKEAARRQFGLLQSKDSHQARPVPPAPRLHHPLDLRQAPQRQAKVPPSHVLDLSLHGRDTRPPSR